VLGKIVAIAGFGFPARFAEKSTINHPAQPFFGKAVDAVVPRLVEILRRHVGPRLPRA
jgi:hypothetical protein